MNIPEAIKHLCSRSTPYRSGEEYDRLFVAAMQAAVGWHRQRCEYFARLLDQYNVNEASLNTVEDCAKLPLVHANFFKTHTVKSIDDDQISLTLTSSGTSGQKSRMFFDDWSIGAGRKMIDCIYDYYGWNQPQQEANYLLYTYETLPDSHLGTAATDNYLLKYAKANRIFYALRLTDHVLGEHEFDVFGTIETLQSFAAEEGLPVRIQGFPSFMYFTLKRMEDLGMEPLRLHPDSMTAFGGGWKGYADQQIAKQDLYEMIEHWLGIPRDRCRDGYGSVEHAVPYFECPEHQFHVPIWSRIFIRDVRTLEPLGYNQPGFLHFVTPYITSVPAISVLMGDLAVLHSPEECSCGLETPYFEILGRAGTSKNRSCAIAASELLQGRKV